MAVKIGGRVVEILVEPSRQRRRNRPRVSEKKKAAALFRLWHDARQLMELAERLDDSELVHLLAVTQLLVEERAATLGTGGAAFDEVETGLPN